MGSQRDERWPIEVPKSHIANCSDVSDCLTMSQRKAWDDAKKSRAAEVRRVCSSYRIADIKERCLRHPAKTRYFLASFARQSRLCSKKDIPIEIRKIDTEMVSLRFFRQHGSACYLRKVFDWIRPVSGSISHS
jgi:hypothetical protein